MLGSLHLGDAEVGVLLRMLPIRLGLSEMVDDRRQGRRMPAESLEGGIEHLVDPARIGQVFMAANEAERGELGHVGQVLRAREPAVIRLRASVGGQVGSARKVVADREEEPLDVRAGQGLPEGGHPVGIQALVCIENKNPIARAVAQALVSSRGEIVPPREPADAGTEGFGHCHGAIDGPRVQDHHFIHEIAD